MPAGSLLAFSDPYDSMDGGEFLALDPADGGVITGPHSRVDRAVGGAYSPVDNALAMVSHETDTVNYLDPGDLDSVTSSWPVQPAGSPPFAMFFGDMDFAPDDGNVYLVSSQQDNIRELTAAGSFVQDIFLGGATAARSGLAIDDTTGDGWIVDIAGNLCKVTGLLPEPPATILQCAGASLVALLARRSRKRRSAASR